MALSRGFLSAAVGAPAGISKGVGALETGMQQLKNRETPADRLDQDLSAAMEYLRPYMEAATPGLQGLQRLSTPEGQEQAIQGFAASPMYAQQMAASQEAAARAANATGYGRSGQAIIEQSQIPLALQQNYLNDQTSRYGQLAGFGTQPSSQAFSGTVGQGQFSEQLANNMQMAQMNAKAQKDANSGNFWGDLLGIGASLLL